MNKVIMTGYVVKDPEVSEFKRKRRKNKRTSKYGLVASFRLSVKRPFRTKDGTKYEYFSCSAFDKSAEFIEEYIEKGDYVGIEGLLFNDNYENEDGMTVYKDKINLDKIELLRKRKDEEEDDYEDEEEEDYDDEFYDADDYEDDDDEEDDYEEEYLEDDEEDDEDDEEEGYHRSIKKGSQKKGSSDLRRKNSRIKSSSSRKQAEQRKKEKEKPERRNRQSRKSVPERRRNEGKKRNLVDEEFERVQESEYNNYGFD